MEANKICKSDIKSWIKEELKCDYGFIKTLMANGTIQDLQNLYAEDRKLYVDAINDLYSVYRDYCETWKLDYEADNRDNKEYLKR